MKIALGAWVGMWVGLLVAKAETTPAHVTGAIFGIILISVALGYHTAKESK